MNYSADRATPGEQPQRGEADSMSALTQGVASLSEWAEFSALIQKLDDEYAETLAAPLMFWVENPKPTDS